MINIKIAGEIFLWSSSLLSKWHDISSWNSKIYFPRTELTEHEREAGRKGWKSLSSWVISKEPFVLLFAPWNQKHLNSLPTPEMLSWSHFLLSEVVLDSHFAVLKFTSYSFPKPHPSMLLSSHPPQKHLLPSRVWICKFRALHNR